MQGNKSRDRKLSSTQQLSPHLIPISYDNLNGWQNDDHLAAFRCFQFSAARMSKRPYTTKSLGIPAFDLVRIGQIALDQPATTIRQARKFFETNFLPHQYELSQPDTRSGDGSLLTGYFEPQLPASPIATQKYKYPLYRRPDDLIDIDDTNRPKDFDESFAFGKFTSNGVEEFFDRGQIQNGVLENQDLELVWLENPIDVYFVHIQGSARLVLEDGSSMRVSYAAKSGHPYTPIGKVLVDRRYMKLEDITMQSIRQWLEQNPKERDGILGSNRSYIFFQIIDHPHPQLGPIAAAGVALTAGRSLAIDHRLHTFATPFWVETKDNFVGQKTPFSRLLIAQDTGSAIIGPTRADLFVGTGHWAGLIAGQVKHAMKMIALLPKSDRGP